MMHGLCRGMLLERFQEFLVFYKKFIQKCGQVFVLHALDHANDLSVHIVCAVLADWKIICRVVFSFMCLADSLDI